MDYLIQIFKESYISQIMWMVLGAIIIKVFEVIKNNFNRFKKNRMIKKNSIEFEYENIISLDHGDPYYTPSTLITRDCNKELIISIPDNIINEIRRYNPHFEYREGKSFNGQDNYSELEKITGINNLQALIEKYRVIVGEQFLQSVKAGKTIFNGEKFGVRSIISDRKGLDEEARLIITFYRTDYFTHRVFREIYRELAQCNASISKVTKLSELNNYYPFLTSFGVNSLLVLDNYGSEEIVLAERSKAVSNMNGEDLWHVSMNEGLSITDIEDKKISLLKCLNRGLKEELGIREEHMENVTHKSFNDLFINMDNFEIGLTSVIKTEIDFNSIENLYKVAKDAELETNRLIKVKGNRSSVKRFIEENNTTKACNYCINMYLARKENFI